MIKDYTGRYCANCAYWQKLHDDDTHGAHGECRLNAPIPAIDSCGNNVGREFPETYMQDWCGFHAAGEEAAILKRGNLGMALHAVKKSAIQLTRMAMIRINVLHEPHLPYRI